MKSRFAWDGPSRFGADSATPAPCTSTIATTAAAPVTSETQAETAGTRGSGTHRDLARVLDLDHGVETGDQDDEPSGRRCDQRADDPDPRAGEEDQDRQRPEADASDGGPRRRGG